MSSLNPSPSEPLPAPGSWWELRSDTLACCSSQWRPTFLPASRVCVVVGNARYAKSVLGDAGSLLVLQMPQTSNTDATPSHTLPCLNRGTRYHSLPCELLTLLCAAHLTQHHLPGPSPRIWELSPFPVTQKAAPTLPLSAKASYGLPASHLCIRQQIL